MLATRSYFNTMIMVIIIIKIIVIIIIIIIIIMIIIIIIIKKIIATKMISATDNLKHILILMNITTLKIITV